MKEKEPGLALACVGINHRTAPLPVRESMWFSVDELPAALRRLRESRSRECILISTCNRTELYYVPVPGEAPAVPAWQFLASLKRHEVPPGPDNFYHLTGLQPVKHLFKVVSGIDSMVLGDVQITAQVKDAYTAAIEHGTTGTITNRLFTAALHVGKRVRTETQIGEGAISVSYLAAELATKIFADLSKRTALLVGIGETGKLTARHLASRNLGHMVIANRTFSAAEKIAPLFGGRAVPFDSVAAEIPGVDIIITAVQTSRPILTMADIAAAMKMRSNRPLIIIDLGVPRNADPLINSIDNVFLHDIDALNRIIDLNVAHRRAEVPKAQKIILEELNVFYRWTRTIALGPTFQDLRDRFEAIRGQEVERIRHRFSEAERGELDILTKRIVNKLLHTPMTNMRNGRGSSDHQDTHKKISLIRHLFGLDKQL
ncbi:MAG TPA: glutamyl-tRNA reductase [Bacteroidota bacterium]|nr:glutamyl-tRNA reductase [Bacteroidota bacterium]